jgi:EpsI family protein
LSKNPFIISIAILLAAIASIAAITSRGEPVVVATNLENIPMEISGFNATEDFFSQAVYDELNADKHVYRHYRSAEGQQVDLYIGYYGTHKGGRTPHNPYACFSGAGWGIVDSKKIKLVAQNDKSDASVNYILAQKGDSYESVLHWYQSDKDKILDSGVKQNIQRFIGRVFYNRNDGAFVRVSAISRKEHLKNAEILIRNFAIELLALLPQYWPEEK